ncbi:SNARE domain-containing protein [Paracoccidioides lutzii Pb01]|uniref:t-SNARE affecting a late Golgi compartment protein 1 n=1 Tax=Paracoccidioides lutzii (strain ATCC MYA-826 / Pb01) TaxID=502779 RepID=C1H8Z4_PARBA|nr:SNARE domain-containing protein [Paracoccidioides lutzii Pb01]EEH36817.2 SNARE domain-containing protein [Paracoccidioides lutzii Pb01]
MASSTDTDPFLQVQAYVPLNPSQYHPTNHPPASNSDVLSALTATRPLFSSYIRIRSLATSPTNPELQQARSELETTLQDLSADLKDLVESVRVVEHDPYRYGLELDEVGRRRQLVEDVGREIEEMRAELVRTVTASAAKGTTGVRGQSGLPSPSHFDHGHDDRLLDNGERDDYYAQFEQQRQQELMTEQDQQIDGVFQTVGTLRRQADDMGRELEEQTEMLKDVDSLADRVGGKLQVGVRRVGKIIRRNEGMHGMSLGDLHWVLY